MKLRSDMVNWNILFPEEQDEDRLRLRITRGRHGRDDLAVLRRVLTGRYGGKLFHGCDAFSDGGRDTDKTRSGEFRYPANNFMSSSAQLCMVKMNYSWSRSGHRKFLGTYLVQKNKEGVTVKPELFGNIPAEEYKKQMVNKHYKFILSPELNLDKESLKLFAEEWVRLLGRKLGRELNWQAAVHTDTAHPHVHILINGRDASGRWINRIPSAVVKTDTRKWASEILTGAFGNRSEEMKKAAREKSILAERWTGYDEEIASDLFFENGMYYASAGLSPVLCRRLEKLESLGLAAYSDGRYCMRTGWQERLHDIGRYNTLRDSYRYLEDSLSSLAVLKDAGTISGTVRHVYRMDDEEVWNNAVVIEDVRHHRAWYVPLLRPVSSRLEGQDISVTLTKDGKGRLSPIINITGRTDGMTSGRRNGSGYER